MRGKGGAHFCLDSNLLALFLLHKKEVVERASLWAVTRLVYREDLTVKCVPSILLRVREDDFHVGSSVGLL